VRAAEKCKELPTAAAAQRFEGGGAKGHSERRIRQGRRNFVRDGESAHNIWAPIHKSRRISPRRVERIVYQVIGDRAGVMTDALT